jgi:hypothetical protein
MKLLYLHLALRIKKIRPQSLLVISFLLSALIFTVTSPALAIPMPAVDPTPAVKWTSAPDLVDPDYDFTYGFSFMPKTELWVTHLGVYDSGGDGLEKKHDVGLWHADGSEIATATVDNHLGSALDGHFRYVEVDSPVKLEGGFTYVVGAYWQKNKDPFAYNPEGLMINENLWYLDDAMVQSNLFQFPKNSFEPLPGYSDITGWFGANLKVLLPGTELSPVPEPGTVLLLGIGLIGIAGLGRKRLKTV